VLRRRREQVATEAPASIRRKQSETLDLHASSLLGQLETPGFLARHPSNPEDDIRLLKVLVPPREVPAGALGPESGSDV
jgi:hypothetical protein